MKGYQCLHWSIGHVYISRHVTIVGESNFPFTCIQTQQKIPAQRTHSCPEDVAHLFVQKSAYAPPTITAGNSCSTRPSSLPESDENSSSARYDLAQNRGSLPSAKPRCITISHWGRDFADYGNLADLGWAHQQPPLPKWLSPKNRPSLLADRDYPKDLDLGFSSQPPHQDSKVEQTE